MRAPRVVSAGVKVELLYFDGCPGFAELLPQVRELVGDRAVVELHAVDSLEEAERVGFLGSPTLRVDGVDIDPGAAGRTDFGMKCRLYRTADGQFHAPPAEWIRRAVERAALSARGRSSASRAGGRASGSG